MSADLIRRQIEYYRARAGEYDEWFLRRGRYDRGAIANEDWSAEVDQVRAALDRFTPGGRVLELACGTGLWTERLLPHASRVVAVDAAPEALALNRDRSKADPRVEYVLADLFTWRPDLPERFDVVFFAFWLSHVPRERFRAFWRLVSRCLRPGGRVFFIDSRREPTSTARDHLLPDHEDQPTLTRKLNDGRCFEIYKAFYEPAALTHQLDSLGWGIQVQATARYFLWGQGRRASAGQ
ncbi:MAG: class I SAM-dependent methyltransferase [Verrucomicrobia bacterium]|nr:class I SAM-dependent methyltransferase [Verrucomicrobiota bacterium]